MVRYGVSMLILFVVFHGASGQSEWIKVKQLPDGLYEPFVVDSPFNRRTATSAPVLAPPAITSLLFISDSIGWAAGYTGTFLRSVDGGRTWWNTVGYPGINFQQVCFTSQEKGWAVGSMRGEGFILHSKDRGASWHLQKRMAGWLQSLSFVDSNNGWASGWIESTAKSGGAILRTQDGGQSWEVQYVDEGFVSGIIGIEFANQYRGWAISDDTILGTEDGGKTWKRQAHYDGQFLAGLEVVAPSTAWVVGARGAVLHTTDAGESWNESRVPSMAGGPTEPGLTCVQFVNGKVWLGGIHGGIYYSDDNGKTWRGEYLKGILVIESIAATSKWVFIATSKGSLLRKEVKRAAR